MSALQGVASSLEKNASEPKLQALLGDFIDYNLKSITAAQSDETADAPHFKTSARLEPMVPIPDGHQLRSWLGGNPRLPDPFAWPERNGVPYDFIGQIDCSELPAKLWGGLGPRKGWLAVFCAAEGSAASKVLYSSELGLVRFAPMNSRTDLFEHYHHRRLAGDLEGWQFGAPEWPVRVVTAPGKGPGWRSKDKSPHDGKVVDLSQAAYAPHSWETAKLLFKVMRHHVSEDGKRARNSLVEKQQALKADDRVELQIAKEAKAFLAELKVLSDSEFNPVRWARVATAAKNWRRLELEEILSGAAPLGQMFYGLSELSRRVKEYQEKERGTESAEFVALDRINSVAKATADELNARRIGSAEELAAWAAFKALDSGEWRRLADTLRESFEQVDDICVRFGGPVPKDTQGNVWARLATPLSFPLSLETAQKYLLQTIDQKVSRAQLIVNQAAAAAEEIEQLQTQIEALAKARAPIEALIERAEADRQNRLFTPEVWNAMFQTLVSVKLPTSRGEVQPLLAVDRWKYIYESLRSELAARDYCKSPSSLPAPQQAHFEAYWAWLADQDAGRMGGMPGGWSYEIFDNTTTHCVLFEIPWSNLFGWQFGDVNSFLVSISLEDLDQGNFDNTGADITN